MNKFKLSFTFLIIFYSSIAFGVAELYRPMAEHVGKKAYEVDFTASFFTQSALFDIDGNEVVQGSDDSYSKIDGDLTVRYGFGKALEFSLLGRFRRIGGTTLVNNVDETFSVTGAESFGGGIKYTFKPQRHWRFAMEFLYRQSLYDNTDFANTLSIPADEDFVLGDSGSEVTFTGHLAYRRTRNHYIAGAISYRAPPNSLSPEIPYFLESVWPHTRWAFKVGVKGIFSMGGDEFTDNPLSKPVQKTGPTALFNSINRQSMAPYGGFSYAFDSFRFDLTAGQVISGVSTDKGLDVLAGIVWRSKGTSVDEEKIGSFKEYEIEASVLKISPRGKFVKIDQGVSGDVEKGMKFDIYQTDFFGGNLLVATGIIFEIGADWAIIKLTKMYKKVEIKKGFTARGR